MCLVPRDPGMTHTPTDILTRRHISSSMQGCMVPQWQLRCVNGCPGEALGLLDNTSSVAYISADRYSAIFITGMPFPYTPNAAASVLFYSICPFS